jgi:hypothetical protein
MVGSLTPAAEVPAMPDAEDVQPDAREPFIGSDRDDDAESLDAVAGCEFVDLRAIL